MRTVLRSLLCLVGAGVWSFGIVRFVRGDQLIGGALVLAGGVLVVVAVRGGWDDFFEGMANWPYFR